MSWSTPLKHLVGGRDALPKELVPQWEAFLACAETLDGGRQILLATLPVGRIEPAPIAVGTAALRDAIDVAEADMPAWRIDELGSVWTACNDALASARRRLDRIDDVASSTDELDHVLEEVRELMEDLEPFADAEAAFGRRWRCPRPAQGGGRRG